MSILIYSVPLEFLFIRNKAVMGTVCLFYVKEMYQHTLYRFYVMYEVLPKISKNLSILRKPLALRTCATRCLLLYLSTISQPTGVFISPRFSEFWLFSLHRFHVCLLILKWPMLRNKEFALNFASCSTKLQLKPTEC